MNKHRKLKACIAIILISHACSSALLAMSSTVIKSANEIFPLFSWSLFTWPNNFHDYALRIVTIDNENSHPSLQEADHWFPKANSISAYDNIQKRNSWRVILYDLPLVGWVSENLRSTLLEQ